MESRKFERFDLSIPILGYFELINEVIGEFPNRDEFVLKNISMGGFNLVSNYPPLIGNLYQLHIRYDGERCPFRVKVIHSRILRFQDRLDGIFRPGVVYSTGCQVEYENDLQKSIVLKIIQKECNATATPDPKG